MSIVHGVYGERLSNKMGGLFFVLLLLVWVLGVLFPLITWTKPAGNVLTVGLVQPNIPQEKKWDPEYRQPTLDILRKHTQSLWHNDWVICLKPLYQRSITQQNTFYQG